jgi:ceroid-lipofuscinosis MFS transporter 7
MMKYENEAAVQHERPYVSMTDVERNSNDNFPSEQPHKEEDDDDEDFDDEHSMVSSILTADGIHDIQGFYCVCFVILVGDMSRGVFFPSIWPLISSMGGSEILLGYSVAAFSFGRILVNPLFGSWSHSMGYSKTLCFSTSILLLGTLAYTQVQNVGRPEFLIVAQTILGIGSGTLGVTRAFVADVTAKRNRTTYMAMITAVQYGGFTVTPIFGALFNHLLQDTQYKYGILRFNMYTAPAFFMFFVCLTTLIVLLTFFQGRQRIATQKDARKSLRRMEVDSFANNKTWCCSFTVYDCCILGCMLMNASTKGSIASFETLGIAVAESHFDMTSSSAGLTVAGCGAVGVVSLLFMGTFQQHFGLSDVSLITGGMCIMGTGIVSLVNIEDEDNAKWRYALSIFLIYSIGYPIGHTAVLGLFSKIVGRRPQGTLLGWFASAGSLARMIFPICSGYIMNYSSIQVLFMVLTTVLLASTLFVSYSHKTLSYLSS